MPARCCAAAEWSRGIEWSVARVERKRNPGMALPHVKRSRKFLSAAPDFATLNPGYSFRATFSITAVIKVAGTSPATALV